MADFTDAPATSGEPLTSEATTNMRFPPGDRISQGPLATAVKSEKAKTAAEFANLADAKTAATPTAAGQPLTHYHSFFSELLSWNNPRASGITYASIVVLILAVRYLDVIRYGLKLTYLLLGATVAAEVAGKTVMSKGLTSQLRPRTYYTLPREAVENALSDVHELLNFFVIEVQRILFAENVSVSAAACVAAFISYYLVKIVPYWGLLLTGTTVLFVAPLVYKTNKEVIDTQLKQASDIVNAQTDQLRKVANKHTEQATTVAKQYLGEYSTKAQAMLRGNKATPATPAAPVTPVTPVTTKPTAAATTKQYTETDFPAAPKEDIAAAAAAATSATSAAAEKEPLIAV